MRYRTSRTLLSLHAAAAVLMLTGCLPSATALPPAAAPAGSATATSAEPTTEPPDESPSTPPTSEPAAPTSDAAPDAHAGHGGGDLGPLPVGAPGTTERLIGPDDAPAPVDDDTGAAFRIICDFTHMAADDPIVKPGQPGASHLHSFFGNTDIDAFTTPETIRDDARSSCHGGSVNASGYWVPTVLDADGRPVAPVHSGDFAEADERGAYFHPNNFYYKTFADAGTDIVAPPPGFRMIVGNAGATGPQEDQPYEFRCEGAEEFRSAEGGEIPRCSTDELLTLSITFPECWDGQNLDSPDHKSHVAAAGASCPSSHPVRIPTITMNVRWPVWDHANTEGWRLASDAYEGPGGFSAHADWFNGWDPAVFEEIVDNCLEKGVNCGNQRLGQGQQLLEIPSG